MDDLPTHRNIKMPETLFAARQMNNSVPVILIVEDNDDHRLMLKILLEMWKYRVIEAENGEEAVRVAEKMCPDLIIMDTNLPFLDGFDTTRCIRESVKIGDVPVVFLSGCAEAIYRDAANTAGGNEYLVKPLDFEALKSTLGKYIHQ